ncbi:MAG: FAD-dependent oxidoreductase [Gemmatimonadetes bacterium]|nr:FAD-dependent oxidoreductase [Gemmatimonadota bacterium]
MRTHPATPNPTTTPPPSRRTFIKAGLAATGLGPAISALPGCGDAPGRSPRQTPAPPPTRTNENVLVIGAGIAGLAAASELRASGFGNVVVLEARDRIGGRIWTANLGGALPVDLGASWIHGIRRNPIADIARRSGIETRPTDWDNAVLHFHDRAAPTPDTPDLDGFWALAQTRPRASLRSILDEYLETHALSATQRRYLEHLLNTTVEHEYGADLTDLSLDSVDGGSEYGGSDVLFPGGYGQIVEALSDGLEVRLGQAVTGIDHTGAQIVATTASGARFEADRVVVTLPLGILKNGLVSFSPPLPPARRQAIADLKMGVLNKTCLLFEDVFWEPGVEVIGYVGADRGQWAETLSLHPYTGQPVLMMFNAAAYGTEIERLADREIVAEAVAALADMYGAVPQPTDALVTRWGSDPWTHGSYSYVPVGSSFERYAALGEPIGDRVFFAGEATHPDHPATVHGAFLSGVRAAREIAAVEVG